MVRPTHILITVLLSATTIFAYFTFQPHTLKQVVVVEYTNNIVKIIPMISTQYINNVEIENQLKTQLKTQLKNCQSNFDTLAITTEQSLQRFENTLKTLRILNQQCQDLRNNNQNLKEQNQELVNGIFRLNELLNVAEIHIFFWKGQTQDRDTELKDIQNQWNNLEEVQQHLKILKEFDPKTNGNKGFLMFDKFWN